jgi:hypothetical protein
MADSNPPLAASAQPPTTPEFGTVEAIKRLPKGTKVTLPELDEKGKRAFVRDAASSEVSWLSKTVAVGPEHVLKVGEGYVVTVDGRRVGFAA